MRGIREIVPLSRGAGGVILTHPLLSEAAGVYRLPQPWGDPGKLLKGKQGSVALSVAADKGSLLGRRSFEDADGKGCRGREEMEAGAGG